jgi:hypothetical protein
MIFPSKGNTAQLRNFHKRKIQTADVMRPTMLASIISIENLPMMNQFDIF